MKIRASTQLFVQSIFIFLTPAKSDKFLDWQKMSPLVLRLEETFQMLEKALSDFVK
jgi:hypothetical protein